MPHSVRHIASSCLFKALFILIVSTVCAATAQNNVNVRVMAANLNGNTQNYQPFALRILQGTKADVVCIQEFNYNNNTSSDFRSLVDISFGTNFVYYREPYTGNGDIPNGIISRYPIIAAGSWNDTVQSQPNRGFAWAQINLPGTNDLYVVSVHLLTSSASNRNLEAGNLKALIQANFPANAWVVIAGDFNTDSRTESTMTTFNSFLSDHPVPADNNGNSNTSGTRSKPHDYVLPSFSLTNLETATVFPSHAFPNGLVFDSTVYTPLSDAAPVQFSDSTNAQHMAVMKDFLVPVLTVGSNSPPVITSQPQSQTVSPGSNVTFSVSAYGTAPLAYRWLINETNFPGAQTNYFTLNNVQFTNAGNYTVLITNLYGSITSSIAVLTVSNFPPVINTQPGSRTANIGDSPTFTVDAGGTAPLSYQWLFGGINIPGANTNTYTRANVQTNEAGNYSVIITNIAGSVTSSVAKLTIYSPVAGSNLTVIAQWNFNSVVSDATVGTGTRSPSTGLGSNAYVGGTAAPGSGEFATGSSSDANATDNSAWNTSGYPAATASNKSAGVKFTVSTAGRENIVITWDSQASNSGSKYSRLQYTTNGVDFIDFPTAVTNPTSFTSKTNSLINVTGINNNTNFAFRIVSEFESTATGVGAASYVANTTYGTGGTIRFDMVTVYGSAIATNLPPASPVIDTTSFSAGKGIQFNLRGTTGATYVIEASTNIFPARWTPVFTNFAPFTFRDTNPTTAPQRFYRAVTGP